jgi:muramoyltetrapeptide carboxypeptidase
MKSIFPNKLRPGSHIRVIAPSRSLSLISKDTIEIANNRLVSMGFEVSFGKYVNESDDFSSTTIEHRLADLHNAFLDENVDGILTVIGGFNSNQLLKYINWDIIKRNPKVFCGYSDITALNNSIYAMTGLVTYSGPHYSSFGQKLYFNYTQDYFVKTVMEEDEIQIIPSREWFDDQWWMNQDQRKTEINRGFVVLNEGESQGTILGGNLCTLNLLQGTEFMPDLSDSILFVEDDELTFPAEFDRNLQSLMHLPSFAKVKGLVIGRFQKASKVNIDVLAQIIKTKKELQNIPIVAGLDFGHTDPKITLPIGGRVSISAKDNQAEIVLTKY